MLRTEIRNQGEETSEAHTDHDSRVSKWKRAMEYFTLDQWIADQDSEAQLDARESARLRYSAYLESVRSRLPVEFLPLTDEVSIHDARVLSLEGRFEESVLELRLDPGPFTNRDWVELRLNYIGIGGLRLKPDPERGLAGPNGFGDLGYDEIEVLDGGMFEHRLLFSSGIELAVAFAAFRLERR